MNIEIHTNEERGRENHEWLQPTFSFSFANYYNPERMGFGKLRVLNEDIIAPTRGFDMHPHANMEIVTIPLEGSIEHKDSMGNAGIIEPGEIQRMSAGSGIVHSEYNPSPTQETHLLQIWVEPKEQNIPPSYEQKKIELKQNELTKVVSVNKVDNLIYIHQNAFFFMGKLEKGVSIEHRESSSGQGTYLFVIAGKIAVEGKEMSAGDAAAITETKAQPIHITAIEHAHLLAIEVPIQQ
jgi:quercetin 2,3-dioxygenase